VVLLLLATQSDFSDSFTKPAGTHHQAPSSAFSTACTTANRRPDPRFHQHGDHLFVEFRLFEQALATKTEELISGIWTPLPNHLVDLLTNWSKTVVNYGGSVALSIDK
jgi:hypothetical protein